MARSRRYNRRSSSQRAASLLALALPAPMQRVADTRLGPLLMLLGIPTALVGGLLNINWDNGQPQLSIDPARAAEIRNATQQEWQRLGNSGLGQTASELWNNYATPGSNSPFTTQPTNSYGGVQQNHQTGFPSTSPRSSTYGQTTYAQNPNNPRSTSGTYVSSQGHQGQTYPTQGYQTQASPSDYHRNTLGGTPYSNQGGYPQSSYTQNNNSNYANSQYANSQYANSQYANSQYAQTYQQTNQLHPSAQQYQSQNTAHSQYSQYSQPTYQQNSYQSSGYQQPAYSPFQQQQYQHAYPGQQQPIDSTHTNPSQYNQPLYNQQQYNQQQYSQPQLNQQSYQYPSLDPSLSQSHWNNTQTRSNSYPQSYVGNQSLANPNSGWQVSQPQSGYQQPAYNQSHTASPNLNNHGRY